jgi:hypothetical protein
MSGQVALVFGHLHEKYFSGSYVRRDVLDIFENMYSWEVAFANLSGRYAEQSLS